MSADDAPIALARTRQAIIDHVRRRMPGADPTGIAPAQDDAAADQPPGSSPSAWSLWRAAGERYWQGHPGHALLQLARSGLAACGRRHPWAFVGGCAVAGASLVMARPWKLISVTSLLVAIARTAVVQAAHHARPPLKEP